ncbi:MAG TPA: TonB-dependent receptor [bacterium]|nr:TonB-dependent receptor [bacterium]
MKRVILILSVLCIAHLGAQEKGTIKGKVLDAVGKQPLAGVSVRIVGSTTGAISDINGVYTISGLSENVYKLQLDYIGYQSHFETDIRVVRGKITYVREIEMQETSIAGEEITVEASGFEQDKSAPVSNYNYSREEIRRSPGATGDIFRAIETLPGVSSSGGEFSSFSVRGGSPRDNIVLVDNIPFSKVSHFDGGTEEQEAQGGRFSIFTPGLIESANFQAGGFGARYGGKNASLVDLHIKEGNRETPTVNGTYDAIGWEINYDGPSYIHKKTSLLLSARHQDFNNILKWTGQKDLGHPRYTDIIVKTTTDIASAHKLSFLGIYADDLFDRNLSHVYESNNLYGNDLAEGGETKYLIGLNWRWLTGKKSFMESVVYYGHRENPFKSGVAYTDATNGIAPAQSEVRTRDNIYVYDFNEQQLGAKSQFTYQVFTHLTAMTGLEINRFSMDNTLKQNGWDTTFVYDKDDYRSDISQLYLVRDPARTSYANKQTRYQSAGFLELSYSPDKKITLNPGVRYEYSTFNRRHAISPRVSISYVLNARTTLNGATGLYYQAPELDVTGSDARNKSLKNQKALHLIAGGTRYLGNDVKLTIEGYYKKLDHLIVKPDRTSNLRTNQGEGWARGVDIGLVKRFAQRWYGQISYSRMASRRNDHNGEGWYNSDFSQPNIFNVLFGYEFNKEWSFSTKWKYATGRPKDTYVIHENVFNDTDHMRYSKEIIRNNGDRLDDFHTWNVRVDYRKQIGRFAVVSFVDILNMYGHLNVNEEFFQYQNGKLDKRGFRVAPTMGVKIEM